MSNGLGAGFGALLLLAVLVALAVPLSVVALVTTARDGRVHRALAYAATLLIAAVVAVGGFGVAALVDEAPRAAVLFVVLVFVPLGGAAVALRRADAPPALDLAAATGMAWGPSYLAALTLLFVLVAWVAPALGLSPAQGGPGWVTPVETAVATLVALAGTVALSSRLPRPSSGRGRSDARATEHG